MKINFDKDNVNVLLYVYEDGLAFVAVVSIYIFLSIFVANSTIDYE